MMKEMKALSTMARLESPDCFDVVQCIFSLTDTDLMVFKNVPTENGIKAKEIALIIGKDRSTVQRSLDKLISAGMCFKEKKTNETRGYSYIYIRISDRELFKMTEGNLDRCYDKVRKALKELKKA